MTINQVATISGVSVRTLHHYDRIGLLSPGRNQENGYRAYGEEELDKLQQILFFKACGFPLADIKTIVENPDYDREEVFRLQRNALLHEKARIDAMLMTLDKSLAAMKGEAAMTDKEKFGGFDFSENPYEQEARARWGDRVVNQSNAYLEEKSQEEQEGIAQGMDSLFESLAHLRGEDPASAKAQAAMDKMYRHFNENFGVQYSLEAFGGLGQLYISDMRFTKNIDRYGDGLSAFLAKAMAVYAENRT